MELSPEERRKIYEEEKARVEAREQLEREQRGAPYASTVNLAPGISGLLCYLGIWITGIIFFILEQQNKWVRFHAAQSIVVFGSIGIAMGVLGWIPFIGWFFSAVLGILGVILWIVLMVKAYQGERFRVPLAAELAEAMVGWTFRTSDTPPAAAQPAAAPFSAPPPPVAPPAPPSPPPPPYRAAATGDERPSRQREDVTGRHRELRVTGYAFVLAWCVILLVGLNFFHEYIAYYTYHAATSTWSWKSFFTDDIERWLPILNAALIVSIVGHTVLILLDNILLRRAVHVITSGFGLAAVITLLAVYPFDFSTNVIPSSTAAAATDMGVKIGLICITVIYGISLLVRFINLLVSIGKAAAGGAD
ncbi:MAG: DUF4870 domain-containing protein [Dehalococcoidales bacterium]|jgi:uncharacterized membrane protein